MMTGRFIFFKKHAHLCEIDKTGRFETQNVRINVTELMKLFVLWHMGRLYGYFDH